MVLVVFKSTCSTLVGSDFGRVRLLKFWTKVSCGLGILYFQKENGDLLCSRFLFFPFFLGK